MKRGDIVAVSLQGDYGKPRPALIVQSNLLTELESVVLCPITSDVRDAAFRITVDPDNANGLRVLSQVMVDKVLGHDAKGLGFLLAATGLGSVVAALVLAYYRDELND